jgi:acetylornithine deacetylase/succinyl-diaminopimelate desuccinylase-like protein
MPMTARQPFTVPYNAAQLEGRIAKQWDTEILPQLVEYVRIPAKSPHFDAQWREAGHIEAAIQQARQWLMRQPVTGLEVKVVRLEDRTPVLYFDVPATPGGGDHSVLLYGHLDKQPEMTGWRPGFGPWKPVIEDGRLYGRGAADDGYSVYAALSAILALDVQQVPRPRCVGLIETCEESGSYDLPAYLEALAPHMGSVGLVIALDSGAGNYDQLWATTSLRGLINGTLSVDILSEGVHSGDAGGVVPSSFRIARQLLDRLDDSGSGMVKPPVFACDIPNERFDQARQAAQILGDTLWKRFPWATCCDDAGGARLFAQPVTRDPIELVLNRTWRAALAVTGADGLPPLESAGNVQRPRTALKLSMRLPPLVDGETAAEAMKEILERDPPYSARVAFKYDSASSGWNAPPGAAWFEKALDVASQTLFAKPAAYMGEGGTIPFMSMLASKFPQAQILVTGVLGPKSNAHGPNEFLDIAYAKKITAATAMIIASLK